MPRVIVIGGANIDIKGRSRGTFVTATSNPGYVTVSPGGVGRNIADNLARLGLDVALMTAIGRDANGGLLRQACAAAGVDLSLAIGTDAATSTYLAILDEKGELVSAVSDMQAIDTLTPVHLEQAAPELAAADMLVADCNLSIDCIGWLSRFSTERGVRLLIEPVSVPKARKLLSMERTAPIFAITPNAQQMAALTGKGGAEGIARLHAMGFSRVVLHLGSEGALTSDGCEIVNVAPVHAGAIIDVTGAGDAAVAGLVCGLLDGRSLAEAARLGQCAAANKLASAQSVATDLTRDSVFRLAGLS